jgi:hypothetical protein
MFHMGVILDCGDPGFEAALSENGEGNSKMRPQNLPSVFEYRTIKTLSNVPSLHSEVITTYKQYCYNVKSSGSSEGTGQVTRKKYVRVPAVPRRYPWFVIVSMPVLCDSHDSILGPDK